MKYRHIIIKKYSIGNMIIVSLMCCYIVDGVLMISHVSIYIYNAWLNSLNHNKEAGIGDRYSLSLYNIKGTFFYIRMYNP